MKLSKELLEKTKSVNSVEELFEFAKAEKIDITLEQAASFYEKLQHKSGEIADEELENVAGGRCGPKYKKVDRNNSCDKFKCVNCHHSHNIYTDGIDGIAAIPTEGCGIPAICANCEKCLKDNNEYQCTI